MFQSYALSFPTVRDTEWCSENPGQDEAGYCSTAGEQVATWFGGNTDLEAENGDSTTVGFVWDIIEDLSIEMTYYSINYEDKISSVTNSELLRLEIEAGGLGATPNAIERNSVSGQIDFMYTGYVNKSSLSTDGIDFSAKYRVETSMGKISTTLNVSNVLSFEEVADSESDAFDYAGLQDYPEWKTDLAVNYSYEDMSVTWTMFYVGAQDSGNEEYGVDYLADIPAYVKHNVQFAYVAPTDTKIVVGVNNLLDETAPSFYEGFRDYRDSNWSLYDQTGRSLYLRLEQSF